MAEKIVELPDNFIGRQDRKRLESFGAHLITCGHAVRWRWNRERDMDTAFEIFFGAAHEELPFCIRRDRKKRVFYVTDAQGKRLDEGTLTHIMTAINHLAQSAFL